MTRGVSLTPKLVRGWVWLYTRGLPAELRQARRDEIDSDLWEQAWEARQPGGRDAVAQVLLRLLMGLPADVAWRMEVGTGSSSGKEREMNASFLSMRMTNGGWSEKVFLACAGLLVFYQATVAFLGAGFGLGLWGGGTDDPGNGWWLLLPINVAGLLLVLSGLRARATKPLRAGVQIAVGVLPSILMFWMMLPPLVAIGVFIYALLQGRSAQKRLDAGI